jgi:hypothetical protein
MKFQTPLLLLAALVSFVSGEEASRSHVRDFSLEASLEARDAGIQDGYSHVQKRNPVLPPGADATKLHVWLRLDTAPMKYRSSGDVAHDGLNTIMKDMGGQHVSVDSLALPSYYNLCTWFYFPLRNLVIGWKAYNSKDGRRRVQRHRLQRIRPPV